MTNLKSIIQFNSALMLFLTLCLVATTVHAVRCFGTLRTISIQNRQEYGVSIINNVKYKVRYRIEETAIPVHVDNIIDYLFSSDSEFDECFLSTIIKSALAVLLILGSSDWSDYISAKFLYKSIFYLFFALICSEIFKYATSSNWVNDLSHGLRGYQYKNSFNVFANSFFIPLIAAVIIIHYRKKTSINESVTV